MTITPERKARIPADFDRAARRYDVLTALNPGYTRHLRWSAERMALSPGARVLDLCCGTGLSTAALLYACPDASIDALDASRGMLDVARRKGLGPRVRFLHGDAMDPAAAGVEGPYDAVLMAYGIRNMPDPDHALDVVRDLLAPGGIACFHEYSVADSLRAQLVWRAVTRAIILPLGLLASGSTEIHRYLRQSVLEFDGVRTFEARMRGAGFSRVRTESMDGWQRGIVHSFLGRRP